MWCHRMRPNWLLLHLGVFQCLSLTRLCLVSYGDVNTNYAMLTDACPCAVKVTKHNLPSENSNLMTCNSDTLLYTWALHVTSSDCPHSVNTIKAITVFTVITVTFL